MRGAGERNGSVLQGADHSLDGSSGTVSTLLPVMLPSSWFHATMSVNVPPMSTATRQVTAGLPPI